MAGDDLSSEGSLTLLDSISNPAARSSSRRYTRFCMPIAVSAPSRVRGSRFGHVFSSVSRSRSRGGLPATRGRRGRRSHASWPSSRVHGRSHFSVSDPIIFLRARLGDPLSEAEFSTRCIVSRSLFSSSLSIQRRSRRLSRAPPLHRACQRRRRRTRSIA